MDLTRISFAAFRKTFEVIGNDLHDAQRRKALLDQARREIPIVSTLAALIDESQKLLDPDLRGYLAKRVMPDIQLILTLQRLTKSDGDAEDVPYDHSETHEEDSPQRLPDQPPKRYVSPSGWEHP